MSIKQIRLSAQAREQLIRLKTRTGIAQWNILCRWAFCLSLQQTSPPTPIEIDSNSNVEMDWQTFGSDAQELYMALLKERCILDGMETSDDVLARQFRLHLHRGIGYLATPHAINSISDLVKLAAPESTANLVVRVPDFTEGADGPDEPSNSQEHFHADGESAGTRPDSDRNGSDEVPRLS
jgi:DNA sulfur modification protein DndE